MRQSGIGQRSGFVIRLAGAALGLGTSLLLPAAANADTVTYAGASDDGTHVYFTSPDQLAPADADNQVDVYERFAGVTRLVSTGPAGGNGLLPAAFAGNSADGSRVFFTTAEQLVGADGDPARTDVYERAANTTTLISAGGDGAFNAEFAGASASGTIVFFETGEALDGADADGSQDVYQRSGGSTTLLSIGPDGGSGAFGAEFAGSSENGATAFFHTDEKLVNGDDDSDAQDVYARSGGVTTRISRGDLGDTAAFDSTFNDASADGSRVFFTTNATLLAVDADPSAQDVYERTGATTNLVSTGPADTHGPSGGSFAGASDDGTRVFFDTGGVLLAGDTDAANDVYERATATTTLISTGSIGGNGAISAFFAFTSGDGARVVFTTAEQLEPTDADDATDTYARAAGTTSQLSIGPAGGNAGGASNGAFAQGISDDGSRVFFRTNESLVVGDADASADDVYERTGSTTTLISTGPRNPNLNLPAQLRHVSADGSRVLFFTGIQLTDTDVDGSGDIFERAAGTTVLISAESIPPETTITGGPADGSTTADATPTFTFSTNADFAQPFECRVGAAPFENCSTVFFGNGSVTLDELADDTYTFEVRAVDAVGNRDESPDARTFTVDTTPPDTQVDTGPAPLDNETEVGFSFSAIGPATAFECRIDAAAFDDCSGPGQTHQASVGEGQHTFFVRASDAVGNVDPSPAEHEFTVDTTPPETVVDSGPPALGNGADVSFAFSADPDAVDFECRLDGAPFSACSGPGATHSATVGEGAHTFAVRATDGAGNTDPVPAEYSFTVDLTAPETSIDAGPAPLGNQTEVSFSFSGVGATGFECRLDGAAFGACTGPGATHKATVGEGAHTFEVRALDGAGNRDGSPAARQFTVDATGPDTTITKGPPKKLKKRRAKFAFGSPEPGVSFACSLDGAQFGPCSSPTKTKKLRFGKHVFAVRAIDATGNPDASPATRKFKVVRRKRR